MGGVPEMVDSRDKGFTLSGEKYKCLYNGGNVDIMVENMKCGVIELKMDEQGRIILPIKWRKDIGSRLFLVLKQDNYIKIIPKKRVKLSELFDCVEADVREFEDYHKLKGEALG